MFFHGRNRFIEKLKGKSILFIYINGPKYLDKTGLDPGQNAPEGRSKLFTIHFTSPGCITV